MDLASTTSKILVVQTAFLGDVLLGIPLFKRLRALYPSASLTLLCRRGIGAFFTEASLVDDVVEVDKSSQGDWSAAYQKISEQPYDLVICPHESFRTALLVSRLRAPMKIGYRRFFNRFAFDHRVRRPLELPEALRQLALLQPIDSTVAPMLEKFLNENVYPGRLGEIPPGTDMTTPSLMAIRRAKQNRPENRPVSLVSSLIEPFADLDEPLVVLAPGSIWRTKMWTKEGFIETGRKLSASRGALTVIIGSKQESNLCQEIAAQIPNSVSLAGRTTLFESAQLLAVADLLVCNDSGAMHLGAAADVPTVSIFGPTVLDFGYRPWSSHARVVQTDIECRPCGRHGSEVCPLGHHLCMKRVSANNVFDAIDSLSPTHNRGR